MLVGEAPIPREDCAAELGWVQWRRFFHSYDQPYRFAIGYRAETSVLAS
jgi:hypothetical protein